LRRDLFALCSLIRSPPSRLSLFPYTTLFRSTVFIFGVANAAAIIIGNDIGAGRMEEAKSRIRAFRWIAVWVGLFAAGVILDLSRSEEHTSELQSRFDLVCRLLLEKKKRRT